MIELTGVSKTYQDQTIIQDFAITLPSEGIICLYGPSGCGKTTLLRLIAGLETPDSGEIKGIPECLSYVFQEDRLVPWLSAKENVELVMEKGDAQKVLHDVGLQGSYDKLPHQMSGGMRRRASIARALSYQGQLLLLDEPLKGLDIAAANDLLDMFKEAAPLTLLITHDVAQAMRIADTIIFLQGPPLQTTRQLTKEEFHDYRFSHPLLF